jgi:hypothetical protein
MKSEPSTIVLAILLSAALTPSSFAVVVFDAADDYSPTSNPNGVWSYGYSTVANPNTFVAYDTNQYLVAGVNFWDSSSLTDNPTVSKNMTNSAVTWSTATWQADQLALHPGRNNEFSIIRFTAPANCTYTLEGSFIGIDEQGATTDVKVILNGTTWFSDELNYNGNGNTSNFLGTVTMNAGDTLDFRVGDGGNGPLFDSTGFEAVVVCIPEPSSLFLGAASTGLLMLRRRRSGR